MDRRAGAGATARARAPMRAFALDLHAPPPPLPCRQGYNHGRHTVVYADSAGEDVGIIDGKRLWVAQDNEWVSLQISWLDDSEELSLFLEDQAVGEDAHAAEAEAKGARPKSKEDAPATAKDPTQGIWPPNAENIGGFMIGCDICGTLLAPWTGTGARGQGGGGRSSVAPELAPDAQTSGITDGAWTSQRTRRGT